LPPTSPSSIPHPPSIPNTLNTSNVPSNSRKRRHSFLCSAAASNTDTTSGDDESDSHEARYLARRRGSSSINLESSWSVQKRLRDHTKKSKSIPIKGRLQGFRNKIKSEDPHVEFHRTNTLLVRCSACAEWITMRAVHDVRRWKDHRSTSKCTKNRASGLATRSLFALGFGKSTSQPSTYTGTSPLPCPGLSRFTDHRIDRYMSRTSANGGGAPSRRAITAQLFPSEAATPWQDLSSKQHRAVLRQEESLHVWKISRSTDAIYASKCESTVHVIPSANPCPCSECDALYSFHTFQVAINRPMPDEANMKYVPKAYRCPELGQIYLKHKGVRELVEKVVLILLLSINCYPDLVSYRMMVALLGLSLLKESSTVISSLKPFSEWLKHSSSNLIACVGVRGSRT